MATKKHHISHVSNKSKDWEGTVEKWFLKAPPTSKNVRESIVNITPWIALISGILGILGSLSNFGIVTAFSPFIALSSGFGGAAGSIIGALLGLVAAVLLLAAYPGTKARNYQGWKMLFWSEAINLLASVFSVSIPGVLINLVVFYLLFQIKVYYK